jgi:hypothetical protein
VNVLPWLLDWPPSRGAVGVFLVLTAFSAGTLLLFGGVTDQITDDNVTVESADLTVSLTDELRIPETDDSGVQTCLGSGTPGDSISVLGDVTVDIPAEFRQKATSDGELRVAVSLAHTTETTTQRLDGTGQRTTDVFWVLEDDETLAVGETATVEVRVHSGDKTVASTTRSATVENGTRTYDC